jgi:ribosomal protein S10
MKQYCLKITSKNEKSLKSFLIFIFKHLKTKFNIIQKSNKFSNKKKVVTLLKSPHVNKTAQEHFEFRIFSQEIQITSLFLTKNLIFIKKILSKSFQDVSIKLELANNQNTHNQNLLTMLYLDNFKLVDNSPINKNIKRNKQKQIFQNYVVKKRTLIKLASFLHITSVFGEVLILCFKPEKHNKKSE